MSQARLFACSRWTTVGHGPKRHAPHSYSNVVGARGAKAADRSNKPLRAPGWRARFGSRVHLCARTRTCSCARESRARVCAHGRNGIAVLWRRMKRERAWDGGAPVRHRPVAAAVPKLCEATPLRGPSPRGSVQPRAVRDGGTRGRLRSRLEACASAGTEQRRCCGARLCCSATAAKRGL